MEYNYEMGKRLKDKRYFEIIRDQRSKFILFFVLAFVLWIAFIITIIGSLVANQSIIAAWLLATVGMVGFMAYRGFGIIFRAIFVYFTYKLCVSLQIKTSGSVISLILAWYFPLVPFIYLMIKIQQTLMLENK